MAYSMEEIDLAGTRACARFSAAECANTYRQVLRLMSQTQPISRRLALYQDRPRKGCPSLRRCPALSVCRPRLHPDLANRLCILCDGT
jgi:hypothetical protein